MNIPIKWAVEQHRNLEYQTDIFKDVEQVSSWTAAGHIADAMTIDLHQIDKPYNWCAYISDYFPNLTNLKFCFHRMIPGHYFPTHIDRYGYYKQSNGISDITKIERHIVFLEDWIDGHYLTIGSQMISNWSAGDIASWSGVQPHSALNLGITNRYTLQITGVAKTKLQL